MLLYVIAAFVLSFVVTVFSVPQVLYLSRQKRLMDAPDDVRKLHRKPTANLGGISIFFGFILSTLIVIGLISFNNFPFMLAGAFILFIVGMKDDLVGVGASKKLVAQIAAALLMVYGSGVHIESVGGLFGLNNIPLIPAQLFTAFSIVIILNAFNLIDGIDGLASTIGLIASATLGALLFSNGFYAESIVAFALSGALGGFLVFNFEPAKIFMGDTGSMMVGYLLSFLAFKTMQANVADAPAFMPSIAVFVFAVLGIPMFDTLRIIILRLKARKNPLEPDANHVHHRLLQAGFGHRGVVIVLALFNILIITAIWNLRFVDVHAQLMVLGVIALSIIPGARLLRRAIESRSKTTEVSVSEEGVLTRVPAEADANRKAHREVTKEEVEYSL